jgi:cytochrome c-type biogenesis protein
VTSLAVIAGTCLLAGAVSIASPCVLPLVPAYLAAAAAARGSEAEAVLPRAWGVGARFVAGFTAAFVCLGALAGRLASFLPAPAQPRVAGLVLAALGLTSLGLLPAPPVAPLLARARGVRGMPVLLGAVFALAATPCTTPLLGVGLAAAVAGGTAAKGALLLAAYGAGMAAALALVAGALRRATAGLAVLRERYELAIGVAGGATTTFGVLLALGQEWRLSVLAGHILDRVAP